MAGASAWLAHRRMTRVEGELGGRATPGPEGAMLWYAGASIVWLSAAVLAAVGLLRRDRVRVGRDSLFILLGHFTVVTLGAVIGSGFEGRHHSQMGPVFMAVSVVAVSAIASFVFAWRWSGLRCARLAPHDAGPSGPYRTPETEAPERPGAWRFVVYLASLIMWPAGLVSAFVFDKPHDAHVGMWALRASLAQLLSIALLVCVGLGVLIATQ